MPIKALGEIHSSNACIAEKHRNTTVGAFAAVNTAEPAISPKKLPSSKGAAPEMTSTRVTRSLPMSTANRIAVIAPVERLIVMTIRDEFGGMVEEQSLLEAERVDGPQACRVDGGLGEAREHAHGRLRLLRPGNELDG